MPARQGVCSPVIQTGSRPLPFLQEGPPPVLRSGCRGLPGGDSLLRLLVRHLPGKRSRVRLGWSAWTTPTASACSAPTGHLESATARSRGGESSLLPCSPDSGVTLWRRLQPKGHFVPLVCGVCWSATVDAEAGSRHGSRCPLVTARRIHGCNIVKSGIWGLDMAAAALDDEPIHNPSHGRLRYPRAKDGSLCPSALRSQAGRRIAL
jgi:hypothetical protein